MPRKKRTLTGQVESLNDWMARVDRQVEEAARKMEQKSSKSSPQGPSHRHRARPLRDVNIPVLVFDGGKLNPEQRQALEQLIENSQKHVVQWATYRDCVRQVEEVTARLEKQRASLIQIAEWIHDEYARICRELNPEGSCEHLARELWGFPGSPRATKYFEKAPRPPLFLASGINYTYARVQDAALSESRLLGDGNSTGPPLFMFRMDYGTVSTILKGAISSPAEVDLQILEEAIRWVEDKGTIRRLDRGVDQNAYSSQFEAAAVEMRVLRRLLAHSEFIGATESAQRVLTLLGS